MQSVEDLMSVYLPTGQSLHSVTDFSALYEPAGHSVHTVPAAYLPAAQASQSPLLFGTSPGSQLLSLGGAGALVQDMLPVLVVVLPAGHDEQLSCPILLV